MADQSMCIPADNIGKAVRMDGCKCRVLCARTRSDHGFPSLQFSLVAPYVARRYPFGPGLSRLRHMCLTCLIQRIRFPISLNALRSSWWRLPLLGSRACDLRTKLRLLVLAGYQVSWMLVQQKGNSFLFQTDPYTSSSVLPCHNASQQDPNAAATSD